MLDFRLERYLTPMICRITWVVCLAGFAFWLLLTLIQPLVEKTGTTAPTNASTSLENLSLDGLSLVDLLSPKPTSGIDSLKWFVLKIVAVVMSVLWTRVMLESVVVYFNILTSLRTIEENTRRSP